MSNKNQEHICVKINEPKFKVRNEMHVHTPTSNIAYSGCIKCIEMNMEYIDNLADIPREGYRLTEKKSAQQFVLECISHGGFEENNDYNKDISKKYKALVHFLKKGFPPCFQIFEFTFPFDKQQLVELASLGAYPMYDYGLELYVENKKFDELRAVYEIIKDKKNIHIQIKNNYNKILENE
jgi:hypothetical protein